MNKILKNASLYTIGSILPQALNIILLPLYTDYLSPSEFGIYSSMLMINTILIIFLSLGFERALYRLYFDYNSDDEKSTLLGTISIAVFIVASIQLLLLFLCRNFVGKVFTSIPVNPYYFLTFLISYTTTFQLIPRIYYQVSQQAGKFILFSIGLFLTNALFSIIFIAFMGMKADGLLKGQLFANLIWLPVSFVIIRRNFKLEFNKTQFKSAISFSLPMVPSLLSAWIINFSDRIFIERYFSTYEVGIYSLGYQIAKIVAVLMDAISRAYSPIYYKLASKGQNSKTILFKYNHIILIVILLLSFTISLFAREIIVLFFSDVYLESFKIIMLISLSYFISSSIGHLNRSVYQAKKSLQMMYVILLSSLINICLNYFLVPLFGMYGAAYATIFTYIILFAILYFYSKKCYFIPVNWKVIIPLLAISTGSILLINTFLINNILFSIMIKTIIVLIFAGIIFVFNKNIFMQLVISIKRNN